MILVHRLSGAELVVNADLIETVEAKPDSVITLIDGKRLLVQEAPEEIAAAVVRHRAAVLAAAGDAAAARAQLLFFPADEDR